MSEKYLITIVTGKDVKLEEVNTAFLESIKDLDKNAEIEFKVEIDESLEDKAIKVIKTLI